MDFLKEIVKEIGDDFTKVARDIDETELEALMPYLQRSKVLLLQFEIPLSIVEKAAALAHTAGMIVIVDPAPAQVIQHLRLGVLSSQGRH